MGLFPQRWPGANGMGMATPQGPWPGPEAPPRLLLIDRSAPHVQELVAPLRGLLDSGEWLRLGQLRRQVDRECFLLGRGLLRLMLGSWLGRDPAAVHFRTGPYGKPELWLPPPSGDGVEPSRPRFNVSHSGDLILLGFHACREVGVDVEQLRPVPEWEGIARRCLPPGDWEAIRALPAEQSSEAFLKAWCRMEARVKASGMGLFGVEAAPEPMSSSAAPANGTASADPAVWSLALPQGYVGAAALA